MYSIIWTVANPPRRRSLVRCSSAFAAAVLTWSNSAHAAPLLTILEPTSIQVSHLTPESNYTTHDMTFLSNAVSAPTVDWWVCSGYNTHDGHGYADHNIYFSSTPGVPLPLALTDFGGQSVVNASAYINGDFTRAYYVETFFAGAAIPDELVTQRLIDLYARGATPRLLSGIAQVESSYQQFTTMYKWGLIDRWPTESYDGGSHIGLMQVPTTFVDAWNWLHNTQTGASIFRQKLASAIRIEGRIRSGLPALRPLTPAEVEDMALTLYGPYARAGLANQYYRPAVRPTGVDWVVNTRNNPDGVAYANRVRAQIHNGG